MFFSDRVVKVLSYGICLILFFLHPLYAEPVSTPTQELGESGQTPALPAISTLVPRAADLKNSFLQFSSDIADLQNINDFRVSLTEASDELGLLEKHLITLKVRANVNIEDVTSARARVSRLQQNIMSLETNINKRLKSLELYQQRWKQEERDWREIEKTLKGGGELENTKSIFVEVSSVINDSLDIVKEAYPQLLETQSEITGILSRSQALSKSLDEFLKNVRNSLFQMNDVVLFSPNFLRELDAEWQHLGSYLKSNVRQIQTNFMTMIWWVLLIQIVFIFALALLINRLGQRYTEETSWIFIMRHPQATSLLLGIGLFLPVYGSIPLTWKFIFWVLASLAMARLLTVLMKENWQRRLVLLIITPFLLSLLFRVVLLPSPLFRLYIAIIALIGGPLSFHIATTINRDTKRNKISHYLMNSGGAILLLIFLLQLLGFSKLSAHVFESTIKSLYLFLFSWMVVLLIHGGIEYVMSRSFVRSFSLVSRHESLVMNKIQSLVRLIAGVIGTMMFLSIWGVFATPGHAWAWFTSIHFTWGTKEITLAMVLIGFFVIYFSFSISRIVQTIFLEEIYPRRNIEIGIGESINRLIHYCIIVIGFFWFLSFFGFDLQNVAILGGALGIGIGFGLQNIVSNFVSGLVLLIERPVKIGDVVVIGGNWGYVSKLGLRSTVIETYDRSEIIIPNSDLITSQLTNWTRLNKSARLKVPIGVSYGSNVEKVMKILLEIGKSHPDVLNDPEPKVHFLRFGESSLDFELWAWLGDLAKRLSVQTDINLAITRAFREHDIEIPFPQRDLHIRSDFRKNADNNHVV